MPKKPASLDINLIPKDPFFDTFLGKMLKWALSVGRYIVIFTELIVILSFATRFSLDRQITDLNDAINQKEMVAKSYGDLEQQVREIQKKTEQYQQVAQYEDIISSFPKLSAITPQNVKLEELSIKSDKVVLTGTANDNNSLNLLINNLQLSKDFYSPSVDRIETGDKKSPGFHFRITALTKEAELKKSTNIKPTEKINVLDRTQGVDKL